VKVQDQTFKLALQYSKNHVVFCQFACSVHRKYDCEKIMNFNYQRDPLPISAHGMDN
jgi:hypothetical protein